MLMNKYCDYITLITNCQKKVFIKMIKKELLKNTIKNYKIDFH